MKSFSQWLQNETAKQLAKTYSDSLKDIPQDPIHHPEGNVLKHIKLVRNSINDAKKYLIELKTQEQFSTILQNIDFNLSTDEDNILKLSAWLHDIGKIGATTITSNDRTRHYSEPGPEGKIRSLRHEDPEFYQPEIDKLFPIAPENIQKLYKNNQDIIDFLIQRHMDVSKGGFPKIFVAENFQNGILKNNQKNKLLLILIYADKMGREPRSEKAIEKNNQALITASKKNIKTNIQKPQETPEQLIQRLKSQNMNPNKIIDILQKKFKLSNNDINNLYQI